MEPHFVFNALNTIAAFIRTDPERARKLVLAFADHLRAQLARPGEFVTLDGGARATCAATSSSSRRASARSSQ